ncbi:hypothetical protein NKJ59_27450 [Mesorhizobium australicum]|uniref:hypothetical protein n=1 Tax=Mesorhizobium australicum TaxID=536018 RepID=UPI003339055E
MPICIAKVRPEPQRAANETVTASLAGCKADAAFGNMRHKLLACPVVASGNRDPLLPPACSRARWALGDDNRARRRHMAATGQWRFDRLRDKEIADSMLAEIGGKHGADSGLKVRGFLVARMAGASS